MAETNNPTISLTPAMLQELISSAVMAATTALGNTNTSTAQSKAEKPKRPIISTGTTLEKWSYFISRWQRYKQLTNMNSTEISCHLLECCEDELQLALHRAIGPSIADKPESEILNIIKSFAVKEENVLISRNVLRGMVQNHEEDIKHFAARIKGQAEVCNYTVKCHNSNCNTLISYAESEIKDQICKGLADQEIQQDVLTYKDEHMSLDDLINFISSREIGKKSYNSLNKETSISKLSPYRKNQNEKHRKDYKTSSELCCWCGNKGHGEKAILSTRKLKFPAFGKVCTVCDKRNHFASVCLRKSSTMNSSIVNTKKYDSCDEEEDEVSFLNSIFPNNFDGRISQISSSIPHMEHEDDSWKICKPKVDPILQIDISVCKKAYEFNGLKSPNGKNAVLRAIADTGARTTVAGMSTVHALGLNKNDLFPVQQKLCGANNSQLSLLGGIFLTIKHDCKNNPHTTNVLCYIQKNNPDMIYLSRSACETLNIISENFPYTNAKISAENEDKKQCSCPKRNFPPPIPKEMPISASEENREELEKWLLDYYKSSTFNVCEHQPLPLMTGPPLKIHVNKNIKPHAVHTPIPVPINWKKSVKDGLDRDERLGVIEKVPWGTPTTWCSRMVTVAKKDGTPRRTVDLQPLNAASVRQTHHTPSPFNQATSIPPHKKKTVCDAWNGYHSVAICEEDRDKTTFITPWGRYRYRTAPQGYLTAGDAYTRRFDEIITDIPNKTKCVDDTVLWADNIHDIFFLTCKFLTRCGENGITLNPKKFQFGRDNVEFAGFEITSDNIKPCSRFLEAVKHFPTPVDITGIRSWFGLINQVSYSFSMTEELQPFRELLKPRKTFYWDENLQKLFEHSKDAIINKVKNGVRIFDPEKPTFLTTDWSKIGTGFSLIQKHCSCKTDNIGCCKDGWKLVFAGSKFNNVTEARYAPIEGECLAVARALFKTRYFTLGCKNLTIATDHKPLLKILGDRKLEDIHNPRLFSIKEKTLRYSFKIVYIPGKNNQVADAVSRYPVKNSQDDELFNSSGMASLTPDEYIISTAINSLFSIDELKSVTWEKVEEETLKDTKMKKLLDLIQEGAPATQWPLELMEYSRFKSDLSSIGAMVLYKNRIVVPSSLRKMIMDNIHSAH